jgi:hypothetical protein
MWKYGLDMSVRTALKNYLFSVFFFILAWIYPNQQLTFLQNIPNLSTMWKCSLHISVTTALKNDLFSGFFFILAWIYPNQQLICLQNIPNLSTMWNVVSTYRWQFIQTYSVANREINPWNYCKFLSCWASLSWKSTAKLYIFAICLLPFGYVKMAAYVTEERYIYLICAYV